MKKGILNGFLLNVEELYTTADFVDNYYTFLTIIDDKDLIGFLTNIMAADNIVTLSIGDNDECYEGKLSSYEIIYDGNYPLQLKFTIRTDSNKEKIPHRCFECGKNLSFKEMGYVNCRNDEILKEWWENPDISFLCCDCHQKAMNKTPDNISTWAEQEYSIMEDTTYDLDWRRPVWLPISDYGICSRYCQNETDERKCICGQRIAFYNQKWCLYCYESKLRRLKYKIIKLIKRLFKK